MVRVTFVYTQIGNYWAVVVGDLYLAYFRYWSDAIAYRNHMVNP